MVEDTLRGFLAPEWCDELDFPTLDRMNAEYVGADLHHRPRPKERAAMAER